MKFWVIDGVVISIEFTDGCAVLSGNHPWPTSKPHYIYRSYW